MTAIGFTLQPEERYLELLDRLIREVPDYWEVAPETLWRPRGDALADGFVPNGFHARFAALKAETGRPFVAHGVGFSVGSAQPDPARRALWRENVARDHAVLDFRWYTDHLGASVVDGRDLVLPLPLPYTAEAARAVAASLAEMRAVVPEVGVENTVFYAHLGDPLAEPAFLARCLAAPHAHLLLDLHNVFTTAVNAGFEPEAYVARLPLEKVIEIHVSGGADSDPAWLRSGAVLRLDSHDDAVPEDVWRLLERVLPRCPNVRGVTLERMEGTVEAADVPVLAEELARLRTTAQGSRAHALGAPARASDRREVAAREPAAPGAGPSPPAPTGEGTTSGTDGSSPTTARAHGPAGRQVDSAENDALAPTPGLGSAGELALVERLLAAVLDRPEPAEPLRRALEALALDAGSYDPSELDAGSSDETELDADWSDERRLGAHAGLALSAAMRAALLGADPDGLAMTALIVARLRFERLMQGSRVARGWYERDPREFTAAFKRYHRAVPCDASAPAHEAACFDAWTATP